MRIALKNFGTVLNGRPAGKEAFLAIRPTLDPDADVVEIDFSDIIALTPAWAGEFFSGLKGIYGDAVTFLPSDNASVLATLEILGLE